MKNMTEELKFKISRSRTGNMEKIKWNDIYDTEAELINDMFHEKIKVDNEPLYQRCRGYEYIRGFRKYYQRNGNLTDKQMMQLKRLSTEIAWNIYVRNF